MSAGTALSANGPTHPMEMADQAMGKTLPRLCRTLPRQEHPRLSRCTLKMDRGNVPPSTSSNCVIEELRTMFAKFSLPETIITNNGSGFVSEEFETFLKCNGIRHVTSVPYHPASNGLAEHAVQIVKRGLKKVTSGSMNTRLAKVLFSHRITPQTTTGVLPAELLLGTRPRTRLDLLHPNTAKRVEEKQYQQKQQHDSKVKAREFQGGQHSSSEELWWWWLSMASRNNY